jgi:hypothetical protein
MYIRSFVFDFIQLCAPHLTRERVEQELAKAMLAQGKG